MTPLNLSFPIPALKPTLWCLLLLSCVATQTLAQKPAFTRDDTLRGSITRERAWWDLTFCKLTVRVNPNDSSLVGSSLLRYTALKPGKTLQVDLQPPLRIERVAYEGKNLNVRQMGRNAYFVDLPAEQAAGTKGEIVVFYQGKPVVAARPPWDGGFTWSRDSRGQPFIATSCQGLGASVWWPCKDHAYDEPDSMTIAVTVPGNLSDVSNGRLRRTTDNADGTRTFEWAVQNPINNYGVNVNVGDYVHWADTFQGEKGVLSLDYYVLRGNEERAKEQFKQVKMMLRAFEYWFGPYPFYEDGYKLVEVPYLGMEHQSSITYGNRYRNGYLGRDLSGTGWGLKWDFIIVHESGHEWFANNITYRDIADMWIHESFTNYSENLYTEFHYGKAAGGTYVRGTRSGIYNDKPIVGTYHVNSEGSGDMYPKGGNMLHTIRQIIDDDELWRNILRGLNRDFYHQTVDGTQIEAYIIQKSGKNLQKVFDQYLRSTQIPVLDYSLKKGKLIFRWINCVKGFDMPVKVTLEKDKYAFIYPETSWKSVKTSLKSAKDFRIQEDFYVGPMGGR